MMMGKKFKKIWFICGIVLMFAFVFSGCGKTERLDQIPDKEDGWMESQTAAESDAKETEGQKESEKGDSDLTADDYFEVGDAEDESKDYSKYEEKTVSGKSQNVTYSDGKSEGQDEYLTDPVPEGQQNPVEPGDIPIDTSKKQTCYLSISCATILDNMENLTEGKEDLVPSDGVIYAQKEVSFYEGESVFDVLLRETQNHRIHMEYSFTPMYNSSYIEGIHNLYEFDCGGDSGWMYSVNGWYPNYGCSRYVVQSGDVIEWNYTCDLGRDLGQDWMG